MEKGRESDRQQAAQLSWALLSCGCLICSKGMGSTSGVLLSACQTGQSDTTSTSTNNQHARHVWPKALERVQYILNTIFAGSEMERQWCVCVAWI